MVETTKPVNFVADHKTILVCGYAGKEVNFLPSVAGEVQLVKKYAEDKNYDEIVVFENEQASRENLQIFFA